MYGADWYAGMRVVCIKQFKKHPDDFNIMPTVGIVYTIRETTISKIRPRILIRLVELVNAPIKLPSGRLIEARFTASGFKPLDESRIDVFRKILTDLPVHEDA